MVSINSNNGCLWALSRRQMVLRQRQGRAAPVVLLTATGEATKGSRLCILQQKPYTIAKLRYFTAFNKICC